MQLNELKIKTGPAPVVKAIPFIWKEAYEVVRFDWPVYADGTVISEYYVTMKCVKHAGCKCGIKTLVKGFKMCRRNTILPASKRYRELTTKYGKPKLIPLITRHKYNTKTEEDTFTVYGPLNLNDERKFHSRLRKCLVTRKNKLGYKIIRVNKAKRHILVKEMGHLLNACWMKPIVKEVLDEQQTPEKLSNLSIFLHG